MGEPPLPVPLELYPDVYVGRQAARYLLAHDGLEAVVLLG